MYTHREVYISKENIHSYFLGRVRIWRSGAFDFFYIKNLEGEKIIFSCGQPGFVYFVLFFKICFWIEMA